MFDTDYSGYGGWGYLQQTQPCYRSLLGGIGGDRIRPRARMKAGAYST